MMAVISYWLIPQEVYWRIPASMSPEQINAAASVLKQPTAVITDRCIDQQQKKEPAGPDKQLKRVRQLHDDSSSDEDCGSSEISPVGDPGHNTEDSIEQPAPKKMRKWLDSNSESEASGEGEADPSSLCL